MATVSSTHGLPMPSFFAQSRKKMDKVWRVPYQERAAQAEEWALQHSLQAAAKDSFRICLMPIDCQNTFCLPDFELFVGGRSGRGAIDDCERLCEFIYRELGVITEIDPTLDTHKAMQIFHSVFLVDEHGKHPAPMTPILVEEVERGKWKINPGVVSSTGGNYMALERHLLHYCRELKAGGKYTLFVWPYHGMLGGIGHALVAAVEEACFFHNLARCSQTGFEIKGGNALTENYSVLQPEVLTTDGGRPIAQKNASFVKKLLDFDAVVIAGQAKSHCVAWTIDHLLKEILAQDAKLAQKVYLLEDCTSAVFVPKSVTGLPEDIDFTDDADKAFQRFADAGMHLVKSTDPIESWEGIKL